MADVRVTNTTRERIIVSSGRVADREWSRLRGLIGAEPLKDGEGLLIVPCSSIHTHFMSFPIDVLYVNRTLQVVAIDENMVPWRFGRLRRGVRFVIELPSGTARATGTEVGEAQRKTGREVINIYVPTTPNPTSGFFLMVPKEEVVELEMSVDEGLRMIISMGAVVPKPPVPAAPKPGLEAAE